MLSLRKKSPDAREQPPAWHPDFRNTERLPDTKVIRTSFLVNGASVLLAAVLIAWFGSRAYQLHALKAETANWQRQIDSTKAASDRAIAINKQFQAEATKLTQVDAFTKSRPALSELLIQLGRTLPEYVALDRFDLSATAVTIHGAVRGAPDQASGRASTYLKLLKADKGLSEWFSDVSLVNLTRNSQTGSVAVDITFKLKEAKTP
jgi:hypothetical protein